MHMSRLIPAVLSVAAVGGLVSGSAASASVLPYHRPAALHSTVAAPCSYSVAAGTLTVNGRTGASVRADIAATSVPAYQIAGHFFTNVWTSRVPSDATTADVKVWMNFTPCDPA